MRLPLTLASALCLLLAPAVAYAQTEEIQREVGVRLWVRWLLERVEAATGAPPLVFVLTLLVLALALVASAWLWKARRKDRG